MIEVKNISKRFEDFVALSDVSCRIAGGCIYGMVGSNGAGKSTFLRVLTGVYKPDSGEVIIDSEPVYDNPRIKDNMVYVADELFFLAGSNMEKMAKFYADIYSRFDYEYFKKLTEKFGLDPKKNIMTFSKGMRRQAAIILALATRAKYMFFDETFDGLDPVMRQLVKTLIYTEVVENDATAIITSHSLRELEDICDHLTLLHKGGLVLDSDVFDLKTNQFKIQVAFADEYDRERFEGINYTQFKKVGSVTNLIVSGNRQEVVSKLEAMEPKLLEVLPLTLEEIFTYEMESLGYKFEMGEE
ncbi:MAG: ABC transporter ATP-binding protein [Lachnospiraceae bacterium]